MIINASLEKAVKLRKIQYNPYNAVELPRTKKKHYMPLTYDQQNRLLGLKLVEHYEAVIWFMCCTGVRVSEFLALDFEKDIDDEKKVIHITKGIDIITNEMNDTPKTETSVRDIPYTAGLEKYIKVLRAFQAGGRKLTYDGVRNYFKRRYENLGYKGLNIHTFRHTFVSLCYAVETPVKVIQKWAGHASIDVTLNVYTHVLEPGTSPLLEYVKTLKAGLNYRN